MTYGYPDPYSREPEDDPEGYADYLRRKIIAIARAYFLTCCAGARLGIKDDPHSYSPYKNFGPTDQLASIAEAIAELDKWKEEFNIKEID